MLEVSRVAGRIPMAKRLLISLLLLPLTLQAAEVHKCTDAAGRISFSQTPCPTQTRAEILEVKPITTIKPQPPDPKDLEYLEAYEQRRNQERQEQEKRRAEAEKIRAEERKEAETERRHQETLDAIKSRPIWTPEYYPYPGINPRY